MNKPIDNAALVQAGLISDLLHHPLMSRSEILQTPSIEYLCRCAKRIVLMREMGVYFSAASGAGKSEALKALQVYLQTLLPTVTVLIHDAQNQQVPSIRGFFKNFLDTLGHKCTKGETYDLKKRVWSRMIDFGLESKLNIVILLVDEAQAMSIEDFRFLKDVTNKMDRNKVQLITLFMAQEPDFDAVINQLKDAGALDLISRFAIKHLAFPGFQGIKDLQFVLGEIDNRTLCDRDLTWTEFFFPLAFKSGFRLRNETSNLHNTLRDACADSKKGEFPVRQTFLAIRAWLVDNAGYDAVDMQLPNDTWKMAVQYARVQEAAILAEKKRGSTRLDVKK